MKKEGFSHIFLGETMLVNKQYNKYVRVWVTQFFWVKMVLFVGVTVTTEDSTRNTEKNRGHEKMKWVK